MSTSCFHSNRTFTPTPTKHKQIQTNPTLKCINCHATAQTDQIWINIFKLQHSASGKGASSNNDDQTDTELRITLLQALDLVFQITKRKAPNGFPSYCILCTDCLDVFTPLVRLYLQFVSATKPGSFMRNVLEQTKVVRRNLQKYWTDIDDQWNQFTTSDCRNDRIPIPAPISVTSQIKKLPVHVVPQAQCPVEAFFISAGDKTSDNPPDDAPVNNKDELMELSFDVDVSEDSADAVLPRRQLLPQTSAQGPKAEELGVQEEIEISMDSFSSSEPDTSVNIMHPRNESSTLNSSASASKPNVLNSHSSPTKQVRRKFAEYKCHLCRLEYVTQPNLYEHLAAKHFYCPICKVNFASEPKTKLHMDSEHEPDWKNQSFVCEVCGYIARLPSFLRNHKRLIHGEGEAKCCETCGKRVASESALLIHAASHTGNRPFMCDQCPNAYRYKSGLVAHLVSHDGDKLTCTICGHHSSNRQSLKMHTDGVHLGIKRKQLPSTKKRKSQQSEELELSEVIVT